MKKFSDLFQFKLTCQVCGGEGLCADGRTMTAAYTGGFISHADPRVCKANLDKKNKPKS